MSHVIVAILTLALGAPQDSSPSAFNKTFVGRIGKHEVRAHVNRAADGLSGRYSYRRLDDSLLGLKGAIDGTGEFTLEEFDAGRRTGVFRGRLGRQIVRGGAVLKLSGTWSSADGRTTLPFDLVEEHLTVNGEAIVYSTVAIADENAKLGYDIEAAYPRFEGGRSGVVEKLNEQIEAIVGRQVADFRKEAEEWTAERRAAAKTGDDPPDSSHLNISYDVLAADHGLVSLRFSMYRHFPGTAHPSHDVAALTYSLRDARALELEDLFRAGAAYLKRLAEYCIGELDLDGSWLAGAEPKRENYTLWNVTRDGLLITFEEYQVAPYAAGIPSVSIPYRDLAAILRKGGPVTPFLKR